MFPYTFWDPDVDTFGRLVDNPSDRGEFFLFYSYANCGMVPSAPPPYTAATPPGKRSAAGEGQGSQSGQQSQSSLLIALVAGQAAQRFEQRSSQELMQAVLAVLRGEGAYL